MTVYETLKELQKFVTLKTTQRPAFLDGCEEALNKQIPKKPYREGIPQCPNCKGYTIADYDAGHYYNYCGDCGQAIDWSEEE